MGQQLAELPVDPRLGAALLASGRLGCSEEAATVVAMLGVHSIWAGPRGQRKALEDAKAKCAPPIPFPYPLQGKHVHGSVPFFSHLARQGMFMAPSLFNSHGKASVFMTPSVFLTHGRQGILVQSGEE